MFGPLEHPTAMRLVVPLFLLAPLVSAVFAAQAAEPTDSCLASCSAGKLSEDDRATCRLGCQPATPRPVVNTPPPSQPQPQPPPPPPASSQPPPTYVPPTYVPPPSTPAPAPTNTASCEASCASEPVDDRSTCRLMCAQQSRPTATLPTNGGYQPSSSQTYYPPPTYASPTPPPSLPTYAYPPAQPQPTYQPQPPIYAYPPAQPTYQPQPPIYAYPPAQPQPTYVYPPAQPTTSKSPQEIASCQSSCTDGSSTDRATCRLNCASQSTVVSPATSYGVVWGAPPQNDAANRAAVIRQSNNVAGTTPSPSYPTTTPPPASYPTTSPPPRPPVTTPPPQPVDPARAQQCTSESQACVLRCAESVTSCNQSCDQGRMSSTDRATCKLTCEGNTDVCSDECRAREKTCTQPR